MAAALTAPFWEDRVLGQSEMTRLPIRCLWIATGNNPEFSNEMARRLVRIRLDANVEQPWQRGGFRHPDLMVWIRANRGRIVAACLTLCQAWIAAGKPHGTRTIGSYESWAQVVGGVLDTAGIPGFLGNLEEMMAASDSEGAGWSAFIAAWWDRFGTASVLSADLFDVAMFCEPRHLALRGAGQPHGAHRIVDSARGDAVDVGLLNHRHERLLGRPARLPEGGEIAPLAQLRDVQPDRARTFGHSFEPVAVMPSLPLARPVAVALVLPVRRAFAVSRPAYGGHLDVHQPLRGILDQLAQKIVRCAYAAASAATVTSHHRSWRSRPEGRSCSRSSCSPLLSWVVEQPQMP